MELAVVPSFTRIGYAVRRRLGDWTDLDDYRLPGRVIAITGPTSGLGLAATEQLARTGARIVMIARDEEKAARVGDELRERTGNQLIECVVADLGEFDTVRAAAAEIADRHDRLDVLIHNAGALLNERRTNSAGVELTIAVQVVGPFLLTGLLLELLGRTPDSRVLTMSSGGLYTARLYSSDIEMDEVVYNGSKQYARAKRAQVTLNEMWAARVGREGIRFHALHPGWADTPGVEAALPGFRRVMGPLLRTPAQGADTLVWLAVDDGEPRARGGHFWLDRSIRPIHRLRSTRRSDTPERRRSLWEWVARAANWDFDAPRQTV
jgi:NAD(P)-dependent dehydrogenase (short-subunit alcohol dehydrogenase family)